MGRKPKQSEEQKVAATPETPEQPTPSADKKPKVTKAEVLNQHGKVARTYTLEDHGEDFEKKAESYAGQYADHTIVLN